MEARVLMQNTGYNVEKTEEREGARGEWSSVDQK